MAKRRDLNAKLDKRLTDAGIPHYQEPIYRVTASAFTKAIRRGKFTSGKNAWMVSLHEKSEYKTMKCFLSRDGKTGMAITKDGDVVSLFSAGSAGGAKKNAMGSLIPFAVAHGGRKLDCYAQKDKYKNLATLYSRYGARATGKTPFNPAMAPPGWDGESKPPVVAMILPKSLTEVIDKYDKGHVVTVRRLKTYEDTGEGWENSGYKHMLDARDRKLARERKLIPNVT